jgi:hypothetical protein
MRRYGMLVKRVVRGDPEAWKELVHRYSGFLYSVFLHSTDGDVDESGELFLAMMAELKESEHLERFLLIRSRNNGQLRLSTWLGLGAHKFIQRRRDVA